VTRFLIKDKSKLSYPYLDWTHAAQQFSA